MLSKPSIGKAATVKLNDMTSTDLIAEFNALDARRYDGGRKDGGYQRRRDMINLIVDILGSRDGSDPIATAWFDC
jgi:hypothetical protein